MLAAQRRGTSPIAQIRPLWTYLVFNETTTLAVVIGGALILVAVVMQVRGGASQD
jgi:hypothetical protein